MTGDKTLLRAFEDDRINALQLVGSTLDIGGGEGFGYFDHLRVCGRIDSINIAAELRPTYVTDLNGPFPIADAAYDNVICLHTLEHVCEDRRLLAELLRVLRPEGRFVVSAPILFGQHGHYGDFHCHTASLWEQALVDAGLRQDAFHVQPSTWSALSTALATLPWFRACVRGSITKLVVLAPELLRRRLRGSTGPNVACQSALGFFVDGRKAT